MALTVQKPKPQPKIKVVNSNGGMQGGNYNPQQAAPGTTVQNTAPAKKLQPAAPVKVVQPAATAAQVQAAAEAARVAAAAEAARQREALRAQVQGQVSGRVAANTQALKLQVTQAVAPRLAVSKPAAQPKIDVPDRRTPFEKARDEAYRQALLEVDKQRQGGQKSGLSGLWDKLSFGQDRRDVSARSYAEKKLEEFSTKKVNDYNKRLKAFLAEQAKRRARVEGTKFDNQAAFDRAVAEYTAWESGQISGLEGDRAQLTGYVEGLQKAAGRPLQSAAGKTLGGFTKYVAKPAGAVAGKIWQYTLGSGDKNIPSIVTAPSRVINFVGNLNTPDRQIYKEGGGSFSRQGSNVNAWQATQNQRNFNVKPWTDLDWRSPQAKKMFGPQVESLIAARKKTNPNRPPDDPNKILKGFVDSYNFDHRGMNTALVTVADPLLGLGAVGKAGQAAGFTGKLAEAAKATKVGSFVASFAEKAKTSKAVSWLKAEAKTPNQRVADAADAAKAAQAEAQKRFLPRLVALNNKLNSPGKRLDVSIFDDLQAMAERGDDWAAAIIQRSKAGELSRRDKLRFLGENGRRIRAELEQLIERATAFTEQMKGPDQVLGTRFGRGKKFYAPSWTHGDLENYNFLAKKAKRRGQLSAKDLHLGFVNRYFKSSIDDSFAAGQAATRKTDLAERRRLLGEYDQLVNPAMAELERVSAKARTPYGRARTFLAKHGPTALWKKSVLKYRPAWYVNNLLYNVQAATLSGGGRALAEHARLLRPRNFRQALQEVPEAVRTKIANEVGGGKVAKIGTNLENWSRLAAYRALKKKGFTDEAAIKRVNKYLFDYTTRNWERPLKAVIPFWSFQKNLAKAATQMPFDRPLAAIAYNKLDEHQQRQFDTDFDKVVPRLRDLGYTDQEIEQIRAEQSKYFRGRLKVGGKYITTPFNVFSEKGLSNVGVNPYLAALGEVATSTDSFGRPISGRESSFGSRFTSKFPQAQLAKEGSQKYLVSSGRRRPTRSWIGAPGSEGYGLTKEAQGYDPSKSNYQGALDPGRKFTQDLAAFFGQPRGLKFDPSKLLEQKTLQKLKTEYFSIDWKSMDYPTAEARRQQLFKKYGVTPDRFYKGELAKYDSQTTKDVKAQKEEARKKTAALFAEYSRQPKGSRNVWATKKLKELVDSGYFQDNPFLRSFDWTTPATIVKAYRKIDYDEAKRTGNWTAYNAKHGMSEKAKKAQFWQKYYATSDPAGRRQLLRENPQYASRGVKDEATIKAAQFWQKYYAADPADRKQLLAANPEFNSRSNWTAEMWAAWRASEKRRIRERLTKVAGFSERFAGNTAAAQQKSIPVMLKNKRAKRTKRLVFNYS